MQYSVVHYMAKSMWTLVGFWSEVVNSISLTYCPHTCGHIALYRPFIALYGQKYVDIQTLHRSFYSRN